jgi:hypothetical protein
MVQQNVALPDRSEDVGLVAKPNRRAWYEGRIFELGTVRFVDERRQPGEVDRPIATVQIGLLELELPQQ